MSTGRLFYQGSFPKDNRVLHNIDFKQAIIVVEPMLINKIRTQAEVVFIPVTLGCGNINPSPQVVAISTHMHKTINPT